MVLSKKLSPKNNNKIIVCLTGASGFVGSELLKRLLEEGFLVRVLTRKRKSIFPKEVEVFFGDLTTKAFKFDSFFSNCSLFFNCAGEIHNSKIMYLLHIEGTRKLLKAVSEEIFRTGNSIHWVQLSSAGVYGGNSFSCKSNKYIDETSVLEPYGDYEVTKAQSDKLLLEETNRNKFTFSILRPTNILGFGMPNQSFRDLIKIISRRLFFFIGSREAISNYIYVGDVVNALILCAKSPNAKNQIFNVSNDCKLSDIVDKILISKGLSPNKLILPEILIRIVVKFIPSFVNIPLTESRINSLTSRVYYKNSKIQKVLGFSPDYSIPNFAVSYMKATNEE